eukprot:CAMPEP_0168750362 /NCGR_PEP_ID=MMETSP0724-20121128/17229_1 /TAXON_ID=265536 /ORGANISM="Amphiprora sp., Strain CCMP467" /LENGTH=1377 /DNA_ID=CAMNT_0008798373 /DNA_START=1 /DNA_END=4134 /DNA_ORIENTATION=+
MAHSGQTIPNISSLIKKTDHYDKDERYMATSDLCELLKRHSGGSEGGGSSASFLDSNTERQICTAVLRLLHDKSNDVQAIAVKTLGVLLTTVHQEQVLEIADSLTDQVLDASKSELRDVYTIGLRTLVKTIPSTAGNEVAHRLVGRLLDGIRSSEDEEIVLCCLDVLTDLLGRFGGTSVAVTRQHEAILQMCLTQLSRSSTAGGVAGSSGADTTSPVVRKRTGNTLAGLSVVLSDPLLMRMVQSLLNLIERSVGLGKGARQRLRENSGDDQKTTVDDTRALIRTMCSVAGAVGHRLGQEQIDQIIPIFLRFTDPEDAVTGDDEDIDDEDEAMGGMGEDDEAAIALANELRESCFMGFESFIMRCPNEVEHHLEKIVQAALAYMSYDPNYSYGDDGENEEEEQAEEEDEYEDEDDEYEEEDDDDDDDDDDESWKVRRGAVRALKAVVEARKHDPSLLWTTEFSIRRQKSSVVAMALVNRFKEREENCRVGVLDCFDSLLSVSVTAAKAGAITFASEDDMKTDSSSGTVVDLRNKYSGKLVKACEKIMSTKKGNERSKSSALSLLATLCKAPGGLGGRDDITSVFKHVETFLSGGTDTALHREGTSKALRLDALSLVYTMLSSNNHSPVDVRVCLHRSLLPQLCDGVDEQWYKVIAEALRALASVPPFFVISYSDDEDEGKRTKEREEVALMLYNAIEPKLSAHDVDQEIKECALNATASLLSNLHSSLPADKTSRLLTLLIGRLKNETTRIAAIKNLSIIAAASGSNAMEDSPSIDLSPILAESISTMSSFLRLQSRSLKQTTLEALDIVITNHGSKDDFKDGELFSSVVKDITPLVVDSDLHLSHLGLQCTDSILEVCPAAGAAVKDNVLEPALALSTSSLLQDLALDSLLAFLKQVVVANAVDFDELLALLRQRLGQDKLGRHAVYNLAKCIAIITGSSGQDNTKKVLNEIFEVLESSTSPEDGDALRQVQLSLLVTGDLGRMTDLSADGSADRLKAIYLSKFESSSEDLKHAAAYALGNAAVGSPATFIPAIVATLEEDNKKQQYLLLSALREFIKCSAKSSSDTLSSHLDNLVVPLEKHCADEEEGVRTMVAECFGSLTCLHPQTMLPKLAQLQSSHSEIAAPEGTVAEGDDKSKKNALVCWTVATSVKLAIAGKVDSTQLANHMSTFVSLLNQTELGVRTAALLLVYSATHHMPQAVSGLMQDTIVPALYEVSALKLQRTVDLGPFKHNVDDAIPLRKAALSIFSTCLESLPGSLDMASFMPVLAKALGDAEDIQLHAHQIVISMCARHASYVVNAADSFVDPLEKTLKKKTGQKTGTELERLNDWIKSALRVALTVSRVEGVMTSSQRFPEFIARVQNEEKFASKLQALEAE